MRVLPSVVASFLLICSATWSPVRAYNRSELGDTLVLFPGPTAGGILTVTGSAPKIFTGGTILNSSSLTIYNTFSTSTLLNLGTVTRTGLAPITLNPIVTNSHPLFSLGTGATFTTGGTLSLGTGSTVSFGGTLDVGTGLTFDSGATLIANANSTLTSGVTVTLAGNSTLSPTGLLTLGTGSLINSGGTLSLGTNSAVTNGVLTFGTGGAIDSNARALVQVGSGSLLLSGPNTFTGTTTVSGGTLTITGNTALDGGASTLTLNATITKGGSLDLVNLASASLTNLVTTGLTVGNLGTLGGTINFGTVGGNITNIGTAANIVISANNTLAGRAFVVPISTPVTLNVQAGSAFNKLPVFKGSTPSTLGTAIAFLDGVNTNGGTVSLLFLPAAQNLASDPIGVHISESDTPGVHDKYVLQMSYDPTAAAALGDISKLYLAWFDPADSTWKNAVDGNSDGGASAQFVAGAYDPNTDFNLGYYGLDAAASTVWAVIDHNSTFGVANSDVTPADSTTQGAAISSFQISTVPEPSTAALLLGGVVLLVRRSRKPITLQAR